MTASFSPSLPEGKVKAPPSKSAAHRLLIASALAKGKTEISNVEFSNDIEATLGCLISLGCSVEKKKASVVIDASSFPSYRRPLDCGESGSTMRFFIPLCLLTGKECVLEGSPRLLSRPTGVYEKLCEEKGFFFHNDGKQIAVRGKLLPGGYTVDASVSSQFVTGMMFALSTFERESVLKLVPPVESRPYIEMTADCLRKFGVKANTGGLTVSVSGKGAFSPKKLEVEGDWSNAAFLEAPDLFGAKVEVTGLDGDSSQGDRIYRTHFKNLEKGFCEIDLSDTPDLAPVLMAVAGAKKGARFLSTGRLAVKESDRGNAMKEELGKFGIKAEVGKNEITVYPTKPKAPVVPLEGHNDHRIVMALSVLLLLTGGEINGAEAVNKSFPSYFDTLRKLKGKVTLYDS